MIQCYIGYIILVTIQKKDYFYYCHLYYCSTSCVEPLIKVATVTEPPVKVAMVTEPLVKVAMVRVRVEWL